MWLRSRLSGRCGHLDYLRRWCGSGIVLWLPLTADCYLWSESKMDLQSRPTLRLCEYDCQQEKYDRVPGLRVEWPSRGEGEEGNRLDSNYFSCHDFRVVFFPPEVWNTVNMSRSVQSLTEISFSPRPKKNPDPSNMIEFKLIMDQNPKKKKRCGRARTHVSVPVSRLWEVLTASYEISFQIKLAATLRTWLWLCGNGEKKKCLTFSTNFFFVKDIN